MQETLTVFTEILEVRTSGYGFIEVTDTIAGWLKKKKVLEGGVTLFIRHTSASLTIQENADPSVGADLLEALERIAPESGAYRHKSEGPDDMPAHIKSMLTSTSLGVPVLKGRMMLGTWQGIYILEHRSRLHLREIVMQYSGLVAYS